MNRPIHIENPRLQRGTRWLLFALGCVAAHLATHLVTAETAFMPTISPISGVVLAALLLSPRREWNVLLVIAGAITFTYGSIQEASGIHSLIYLLFHSLQGWGAAWLIQRLCGPGITFGRIREVFALVGVATVVNAASAAGAMWLVSLVDGARVPAGHFANWWLSHALGMLIFAPLIVTWGQGSLRASGWGWPRLLEGLGVLGTTAVVGQLALRNNIASGQLFPSPYVVFVPILWTAMRFGPRGVSALLFVVTVNAVTATGSSFGLMTGLDPAVRLTLAQVFLGFVASAGLVLASVLAEKETMARGLGESEQRNRILFEHSAVATGVCTEGTLVQINPAFRELLCVGSDKELVGQPLLRSIHANDRARLGELMDGISGSAVGTASCKVRGLRTDSGVVPIEVRLSPVELEGRTSLMVHCRDLTREYLAEREIQRVNRVLRTLTGCNQALVRAASERELLGGVCETMVGSEGFILAWVGMAEGDAEKTLRVVASAGSRGKSAGPFGSSRSAGAGGPVARAIRTGIAAVCQNTASDPDYAPWREEAAQLGFHSQIALPLVNDGQAFGVLSLCSAEPEAFPVEAVRLLQEMADSLAYGVLALRARERHRESEQEVLRLLEAADATRLTLLSILEDRELAEKAKEISEERYRNAMETSAIGMAFVTLDHRCLEANPALCRFLGYERKELLALNYRELTHPDDRGGGQAMLEELLHGRISGYHRQKRFLHKTGTVLWGQLHVSLMRDPGGRAQHLIVQVQDITARRHAEESLEAVAERLALALRASKFGVWRHNVQTHASEWDARMFAIFGLPAAANPPSLDGILARVVAEDQAAVHRAWTAGAQADQVHPIRFRVLHPGGSLHHVEMHGIIHADKEGRPEWLIGVAGDITAIVQATTESERLRAQLQQSQKMEALGTLAAGVAHDFNNLLTGINGFVDLASSTLGPGHEAAGLLTQARRGASSARALVRRILNYSRSNNEQKRSHLNVVELVRDSAPLIAAALPGNVSLSLEMSGELAPAVADAGQLQQILMNLCTNGAHAIGTKPGRIQIGVRLCNLRSNGSGSLPPGCEPGRYVRLSVQDSGSGMSEETRRRIFEPFFTTKKAGEGTGLGLSIVQDIVATHQGGLEVESVVGIGTTFVVYLPEAAIKAEREAPVPFVGNGDGAGQRILVVDDEPSIAMVVRLTLQRSGYRPVVYSSAAAAWNRLEADPRAFDLVIVDQNMPEISGTDFARRARTLKVALPVVIMSGRFQDVGDLGTLTSGQLKKPFEITELIATVKRALELPPPV